MTVKLAILKSGEDVIADIQEMVVGGDTESQRVVGYFFNKPCAVKIKRNDEEDKSFQISLFPWLPLTKTTKVPVSVDWVVTIVDPIETLEKMYNRDVLKNDQSSSFNEQSNSDQSN
jgi:hypothetical protein